jgi:polar amino acid transport system permease protein
MGSLFSCGYARNTTQKGVEGNVSSTFKWQVIAEGWVLMRHGVLVTLEVSAAVMGIALLLGLILGVTILYGPRIVQWLIRIYVDVIRGTPLLVVIFFVYYGFPLPIPDFWLGSLALGIFAAAHVCEIVRGGLASIPRGQTEAAKALGCTFWPMFRYVLFPQAISRMIPPVVNVTVEMVKGSSLISLVSIVELTLASKQVVERTIRPFEIYLVASLIYFLINLTISRMGRRMERFFAYDVG